jgi:catechol 2,3-dioxygenase-like lactoylglutathione lyase family enzyme
MNITGIDTLVFGVDDVAACGQFLVDYGLDPVGRGRYEALDGTAVVILPRGDASLPAPLETGNMLRKTVYGVADAATLVAIAEELGRDRAVHRLGDGAIESTDDLGFALAFQLSARRPVPARDEVANAPGALRSRAINDVAVQDDADLRPLTLSHVVYFVPDEARATAFYTQRLGFRITDRLGGAGPFLRPAGTPDHHTLFLIQTPPFLKGCEHFTFHMAGPGAVMQAGTRFAARGHQSFWGPGRHRMGSNWFWYFKSPMGCNIEYDADMDLHDDAWTARTVPMSADASQLFLFQPRDKWVPGGPPPAGAAGPGAGGKPDAAPGGKH